MPSDALGDFLVRTEEVDSLLASARDSLNSQQASMYAKCSVVLACAALERFMNDVLEEACRNFGEESWSELSDGRQRYLLRHVALKMSERAGFFTGKGQPDESDCDTLIRFLRACGDALENPSTWTYFSDFGMFGEGTNAPEKIDALLKAFDAQGRSLYRFIEDSGEDLSRLLPGLQQLVEARHAAAHALKGSMPPGPSDAGEWAGCALTMANMVDSFLGFPTLRSPE